ncbi:MAG: dTDP-4-dehydrorhamnose reductase [Candidatus Nitrohelix vancouverensis]|uniref:dTDP-4-dehydrorhamnose reductase n=1 Tax=Candidatus Nitrohelix vancouverensis TaxID=2705534 RepID=A0A7T0C2I0_9BACT|nr:MAG: dTDP-4-dehydrorhamnose reductase [Candidatus Nitrohelix vancouverensis]
MHILILGKNGQVGFELQKTLAPLGRVTAWDRTHLDLDASDTIVPRILALNPDLIVNAAAYTAVDAAETDNETAHRVNAVAPGLLAQAALQCRAGLIHYSTDYVFDGAQSRPYTEDDAPNPLNVYGETKLEGEREIARTEAPYWIFRVSGIYGNRSKNFLLTMQRLAGERNTIRVVSDQTGAPSWCASIAQATADVIQSASTQQASLQEAMQDTRGIYHMTCAGETSWYGFAEAIFQLSDGVGPELQAIPTSEYPTPAQRPPYWVLNNRKLETTFQVFMPRWRDALQRCLEAQSNDANAPQAIPSPSTTSGESHLE